MKNMTTAAAQTQERIHSQVGVALLQIAFRASFVLTVLIIALVGIWAVAALIGGMVSVGGPFELVKGWFSAVSGL